MTERFELRFEWLDAGEIRDEALAKSFARLEVWIGDTCATRALDRRTGTVVTGTNVSLLSLASWAADFYWLACAEGQRAARIRSVRDSPSAEDRRWHRRHGWLSAREGFALPELLLSRGADDAVDVRWYSAPDVPSMPLRFLEEGADVVPRDLVKHELARLVEGVLARCEGIETPAVSALRLRWEILASATAEEQRVCDRAARMGLDAWDANEVDDALAAVLSEAGGVGEPVLLALLDAVDPAPAGAIQNQLARLSALLAEAASASAPATPSALLLPRARQEVSACAVSGPSHELGYLRARILRRTVLGLSDEIVGRTLDDALEAQLLPARAVREDNASFQLRGLRSLVTTRGEMPFVVTRSSRHPSGQRFDRGRALYALVSGQGPRLMTDGFDSDQQESRAFAAELLAPAEYLRTRLPSHVDRDDLADVAEEIGVSAFVLQNQVENHPIGVSIAD